MVGRLVLALCLCASASTALADARVIVLGMRSVEGDDELANSLTDQLRRAARGIDNWSVSDTAVSMAQMSLAHGCGDELDAACLNEIAKGLQVDTVIYGTIRRTSARADHDYALSLSLFDAQTGEIARRIDDTILHSATDEASLGASADKLIARLLTSGGGAISVQANVPDAEVKINGQPVGQTRDGALRLDGLQPGKYRIEITKEGYAPHVSTVSVNEGADTSLAAVLSRAGAGGGEMAPYEDAYDTGEPAPKKSDLTWLGWTLVGVGGASVAGMIFSMAMVSGVNDDELYQDYRNAVALGNDKLRMMNMPQEVVDDVCAAAESGATYDFSDTQLQRVNDLCSKGATYEVLQWVFLGTAIASGGVGAYLLLSADRGHERGASARNGGMRLALQPRFSPSRLSLSATLRF